MSCIMETVNFVLSFLCCFPIMEVAICTQNELFHKLFFKITYKTTLEDFISNPHFIIIFNLLSASKKIISLTSENYPANIKYYFWKSIIIIVSFFFCYFYSVFLYHDLLIKLMKR